MNLEAFRYVREVAECGSFSAAARAYGVTQPALSNGVAKLEEYLGNELFARSPRGVTLTDFGEAILPRIESALDAVDGITIEMNRWRPSADDVLRVGVSPLINSALVGRAYEAAKAAESGGWSKQLVLREADLAYLRSALVSGEIDVMVVPSVEPLGRFEHRVVDSERMVYIEPTAPRSDDDATIPLPEITGHEMILVPDTCGLTKFTRDLFADNGLPLHEYSGAASGYRVLEDWAQLGLGAALLPESKLSSPESPHRYMTDDEGLTVEIFYEAVWNPTATTAPQVRELVEQMAAV